MAKKNPSPESPAAQTPPPQTPPPPPRNKTVLQPELQIKVEDLKKQMSTLKSLNKIIIVLDSCDRDALEQVQAWLTKKLEVA